MKKGDYLAGNLACLNLGDCSLCEFPVEIEEQVKTGKELKQNPIKRLLNKVSKILAA